MNEPTHLDLFSGIGGFSLAAESVGFRTVGFAEVDADASRVLSAHWPAVRNLGDVSKLCRRAYDCEQDDDGGDVWCPRCNDSFGDCACIGTDQFLDEIGAVDLLTGGVPCQPASLLGKRLGSADERWMWGETLRVVRELRPGFALFENPPAILSLESGRAFAGILGELAALGYDVLWGIIPAAAVGAGHLRERVCIVAADADSERRQGERLLLRPERREAAETAGPGEGGAVTDADHARLEGHAGHGVGTEGRDGAARPVAPRDLRGRVIDTTQGGAWWHEAHTGIPVLAHGLPNRLVEAACRCAGNSIVPQAFVPILRAIHEDLTTFPRALL